MTKRDIIRQFITAVGWVVPQNIAYLLEGQYSYKLYHRHQNTLDKMTRTGNPIHRIYNKDRDVAFTISKKHLTTFLYNHDVMLRNCVARFMFDRKHKEIEKVSVKRINGNPDAHFKNVYFEFDNGVEDRKELKSKLERYKGRGFFCVIFIMRNMYNPELDHKRLEMLFELAKEISKFKPNRILGACYSQFLKDGKIYNLKGEEVTP